MVDAWPTAAMYVVQETSDAAIKVAKTEHDRCCVITGMKIEDQATHFLHGAHLFDRGLPRFAFLATLPLNIFPMIARLHTGDDDTFDFVQFFNTKRSPMSPTTNNQPPGESKINWLITKCKEMHKDQGAGTAKIVRQVEVLDLIRVQTMAIAADSGVKMHSALQIAVAEAMRPPDDGLAGAL